MQQRPRPSCLLVRFGPVLVLGVALGGALAAGCEKTRALAAAGQDCDLAIDCLPGLVCVDDEATGRRSCSSDLTSVQGEPPPDGGAPMATPEAGVDAAPKPKPDGGSPPPPQDSGQPPPPQDAATNG